MLAPETPSAIARTRELLLRPGACHLGSACPPGVPCHLGSAWSAPRSIGAELLACADSIMPDGEVDPAELTRFAQHCFVSPGDLEQPWLMQLVQDCKVA